LILLNILKVSADVKKIDLIYTAIFHIPIITAVYVNLRILFPLLWEKAQYVLYAIFVFLLIVLGSGFYIILFNDWIDYIFKGYYFIAYYNFQDISLFFIIYIFTTGLLRLARGWFRLQEIEKEKTLSELKALRSQINPHFLFNSLNSIYSLARKNSPEVPGKIVQLSDLMRHIIYESDVELISLEKEVEMVKNYIELQSLRTSENEKIEFKINGDIKGHKISPLIFLPFVENGFKHGLKGGEKNAFMKIELEVKGKLLVFKVENSIGKSSPISDSKYKGIGIENVKKRLDLIYMDYYSLSITDDETTFNVFLQLQLN